MAINWNPLGWLAGKFTQPKPSYYSTDYGVSSRNQGNASQILDPTPVSPTLISAANYRKNALGGVPLTLQDMDGNIVDAPQFEDLRKVLATNLLGETEYDLVMEGEAFWEITSGALIVSENRTPFTIVKHLPNEVSRQEDGSYLIKGRSVPPEQIVDFREFSGYGARTLLTSHIILENRALVSKRVNAERYIKPPVIYKTDKNAVFVQVNDTGTSPKPADEVLQDQYKAVRSQLDARANSDDNPAAAFIHTDDEVIFPEHKVDGEFEQTLQEVRRTTEAVTGVPAIFLGSDKQSTYNNVHEARIRFWKDIIVPRMRYMEGQMNLLLKPLVRLDANLYFRFDTSKVLELQPDKREVSQTAVAAITAAERAVSTELWTREEAQDWLERTIGQ